MSALAIRQAVEAALAAGGIEVGTYRLPDGEETPAVYLGNPPEGTTASGLEVLIALNPQRQTIDAFIPLGIRDYPVRLVNWDGLPDVLEDATNAILRRFRMFGDEPALVPADPEQVTFSLTYDPQDYPPHSSPEG